VYWSDGAVSQYKNYKNFTNLAHHEEDFKLQAEWNFTASMHGKSASDAVGATAKNHARRASLGGKIITTAEDLFLHCSENIENITFYLCTAQEVAAHRSRIEHRLAAANTVPGTRSHHRFVPESNDVIRLYRLSTDTTYTRASVTQSPLENSVDFVDSEELREGVNIVCVVNGNWVLGQIVDK
jgi:hypothetical protein